VREFGTDGLREAIVYRGPGVADAWHADSHAHIIKASHRESGRDGLSRHPINRRFSTSFEGCTDFACAVWAPQSSKRSHRKMDGAMRRLFVYRL
jgi:hypothetical protein